MLFGGFESVLGENCRAVRHGGGDAREVEPIRALENCIEVEVVFGCGGD